MSSTVLSPDSAGVCPLLAPDPTPDHGIVSRAILTASGTRVTLFRFAAGQELSEHTTPARALIQVLAGACEFSLPGETVRLGAGDLLHLPPGLPHAVRATAELTMLITQVAPPSGR